MANLVKNKTFSDKRGLLTTLEGSLPFAVKRVYFIHEVPWGAKRGGHSHIKNRQAIICVSGECTIMVKKDEVETAFNLSSPNLCLVLEPEDYHELLGFSEGAVVLVVASEPYDPEDYLRGEQH